MVRMCAAVPGRRRASRLIRLAAIPMTAMLLAGACAQNDTPPSIAPQAGGEAGHPRHRFPVRRRPGRVRGPGRGRKSERQLPAAPAGPEEGTDPAADRGRAAAAAVRDVGGLRRQDVDQDRTHGPAGAGRQGGRHGEGRVQRGRDGWSCREHLARRGRWRASSTWRGPRPDGAWYANDASGSFGERRAGRRWRPARSAMAGGRRERNAVGGLLPGIEARGRAQGRDHLGGGDGGVRSRSRRPPASDWLSASRRTAIPSWRTATAVIGPMVAEARRGRVDDRDRSRTSGTGSACPWRWTRWQCPRWPTTRPTGDVHYADRRVRGRWDGHR